MTKRLYDTFWCTGWESVYIECIDFETFLLTSSLEGDDWVTSLMCHWWQSTLLSPNSRPKWELGVQDKIEEEHGIQLVIWIENSNKTPLLAVALHCPLHPQGGPLLPLATKSNPKVPVSPFTGFAPRWDAVLCNRTIGTHHPCTSRTRSG